MIKEARFYKKLTDNIVQYLVSANVPLIKPGEVDRGGVLFNVDGELKQLNYGQIISTHLLNLAQIFSPGIKSGSEKVLSVGFLGNNLRTSFDPYWDTGQFPYLQQKDLGREKSNQLVSTVGTYKSPQDLKDYLNKLNIKSVAFAYCEPSVNFTYIADFIDLTPDIEVFILSNGYIDFESVNRYLKKMRGVRVDLYSMESFFYKKHCKADIRYVQKFIKDCSEADIDFEVMTTLIPGENDSEKDLRKIANFLRSLKKKPVWNFSIFTPSFRMLDKTCTDEESFNRAIEISDQFGLRSNRLPKT